MKKTKFKLKPWQTALCILAIAVVTTLFSVAIQPGAFYKSLTDIITRPLCIVLNGFPVLVLVAVGYFALGNVLWGGGIASLVALLLSYVNLLKIEGRDDAFVPSDIGLLREGVSSMASYGLNLHIPLVILIVLYCAALFTLGFFVISAKPKALVRTLSAVATVAVFALSVKFVYTSTALYNSFRVPQMYNIPSVFNTLGFNYCFLRNFNLYPVDKPDGYKPSDIAKWQDEYLLQKEDGIRPNVIMVMGEAFSDISNADVFDFETKEQNPAYKYNLLTDSERAISGHIAVSNIAAGTANTEFDVLTGMPTNMISDATTSSFRVINKKTPTVASILKDSGYATSFLHPGDSWFYNRSSVYRHFGVDDQVFNESFDLTKDVTNDGLVIDEAFLRELIKKIESNDNPQFIYSVTIQNHQAYNYTKYSDKTPDVPIKTKISDQSMQNLSVYLRGVRDTSEMIYQLAQYIDNMSEPTILVFFGDHLANLGEDCLAYRELGMDIGKTDTPENTLEAYKTPFVIYGNTAYCEQVDFEKEKEKLDLAPVINSNYLGAAVLELGGFSGHDPYFDFLNYARRELPVFRLKENVYCDKDGNFTNAVSDPDHLDIINKVDMWEYHRLRGK